MSTEEEQYMIVERWLRDALNREDENITPEEYYRIVDIGMYWFDRIKPSGEDLRIRMRTIIETYEQHKEDKVGQ